MNVQEAAYAYGKTYAQTQRASLASLASSAVSTGQNNS